MKKVYKAPLTRAITLSPKANVLVGVSGSDADESECYVKEESAWSDDDSDWNW